MPDLCRPKEEAYVAFLDILGFDSLVRHNRHNALERIYSGAFLEGASLGLTKRRYSICPEDGQCYLTHDWPATPVNSLIVSDSIIIWTKDDLASSFRCIVSVVRGILAHSCFNGLPLRGAIDVGEISWLAGSFESPTISVLQTLFGRGVCNAFDLEKKQEWSGCAVADEAVARFELGIADPIARKSAVADMISRRELCMFEVPFKGGPKSMYVVDWVNHPEVQARSQTVANAFAQHNKLKGLQQDEDDQRVRTKLENTLRFVRHVFPDADKDGLPAVYAALPRR